MNISFRIHPSNWRRWHTTLADRLGAKGHRVSIDPAPARLAPPAGVDLLLRLEALVYGPGPGSWFEAVKPAVPATAGPADLVLDFAGASDASSAVWTLLFEGEAGEAGLVGALLADDVPEIQLSAGPGPIASARPAVENPRRLGAALDAVLARAVSLCVWAVGERERGREPSHDLREFAATARRPRLPFGFGAAALAGKLSQRLTRLAGGGHQWQTGWRKLDPSRQDGVQQTLTWPASGYSWLPDDGKRFYADPFVFGHRGRTVLFVEELPYATGRGLVSAVDLDTNGPAGTPRPVLECAYHLSYPSLFERDGTVWMIPETSGNRTIELYRADPFPDRWVLDRVLVSDVSAGDATLVEHDGRLYLFATTNEDGGSTWDQLSIFHAPALHNPWEPHPGNPVLIDAGAARPAGFTFRHAKGLIRPTQDCRTGYGAGLAFCRIDHLDPEEFRQTVVQRLAPDPAWNASGAHTLNVGAGHEVIDRIGPR